MYTIFQIADIVLGRFIATFCVVVEVDTFFKSQCLSELYDK